MCQLQLQTKHRGIDATLEGKRSHSLTIISDERVLKKNILQQILRKSMEWFCSAFHNGCFWRWPFSKSCHVHVTKIGKCLFTAFHSYIVLGNSRK